MVEVRWVMRDMHEMPFSLTCGNLSACTWLQNSAALPQAGMHLMLREAHAILQM